MWVFFLGYVEGWKLLVKMVICGIFCFIVIFLYFCLMWFLWRIGSMFFWCNRIIFLRVCVVFIWSVRTRKKFSVFLFFLSLIFVRKMWIIFKFILIFCFVGCMWVVCVIWLIIRSLSFCFFFILYRIISSAYC